MTQKLSPSSRALLKAACAHPKADAAALKAFRNEVAALDDKEFAALCKTIRAPKGAAKPVSGDTAYAAADKARRKLLITASRLIPMLAARITADAHVKLDDLPAAERRSLLRFVKAASRRAGEPAVIAAAEALIEENSLARDIL